MCGLPVCLCVPECFCTGALQVDIMVDSQFHRPGPAPIIHPGSAIPLQGCLFFTPPTDPAAVSLATKLGP